MNSVGGIGVVGAHATVIRPKHNYYHLFAIKMSALPWAEAGAAYWLDRPDERLGTTVIEASNGVERSQRWTNPREAIEQGKGAQVEEIVDELEHMRAAEVELTKTIERFSALPMFASAIAALDGELQKVTPNLPWNLFANGMEY